MVQLFSSSSIQSTTLVISFNITADGGDGADYVSENSADADRRRQQRGRPTRQQKERYRQSC